MYKGDSHIHSNFSADSKEKLENIFKRALELGLDEVTITDHMDFADIEENDISRIIANTPRPNVIAERVIDLSQPPPKRKPK